MPPLDWDVCEDDVSTVLRAHGVAAAPDLIAWVFDDLPRIIADAEAHADLGSQVDAALSTIEDILIENKIVEDRKRFRRP